MDKWCSEVANLERKASDKVARHVPRDGIEYVNPTTKKSRNHPVMSDGDVDVEIVLARACRNTLAEMYF
jgi:hypothetical protein